MRRESEQIQEHSGSPHVRVVEVISPVEALSPIDQAAQSNSSPPPQLASQQDDARSTHAAAAASEEPAGRRILFWKLPERSNSVVFWDEIAAA